ncbi:MAG TPA: hypothetical protein VIG80_14115 [Bacillaceae bacterium]
MAGRPLVDRSRSWTTKSGGRLPIGDKHMAERAGGPDLRSALTCDLEPMATEAGQRKAEATARARQALELLPEKPIGFDRRSEATSSAQEPELDNRKAEGARPSATSTRQTRRRSDLRNDLTYGLEHQVYEHGTSRNPTSWEAACFVIQEKSWSSFLPSA